MFVFFSSLSFFSCFARDLYEEMFLFASQSSENLWWNLWLSNSSTICPHARYTTCKFMQISPPKNRYSALIHLMKLSATSFTKRIRKRDFFFSSYIKSIILFQVLSHRSLNLGLFVDLTHWGLINWWQLLTTYPTLTREFLLFIEQLNSRFVVSKT